MPNNVGYAVLSHAAAELAEHIHSVKMITSVKESGNFIVFCKTLVASNLVQEFHAIDDGKETTTDKNDEAIYIEHLENMTPKEVMGDFLYLSITSVK